jgi:SAM-dependent methyltransferase
MGDSEKRRFIAYDAYDKLADEYAKRVDKKPFNAYLEMPATLSLIPEVKGKKVLDAGCGTGRYTEWLLDNGAEVIGLDASPKMLQHAIRRVGQRAVLKLHDLREPLTFLENDSIDLIIASLVLDYIQNWTPILNEFNRVLMRDGSLVISVGHPTLDFIKDLGMKDYWSIEFTETWWKGFGEPVLVPAYRRPLQAITGAFHEAGFLIENLVESRPTEDFRKVDPDGFEDVKWRPSFISIKGVPMNTLHKNVCTNAH